MIGILSGDKPSAKDLSALYKGINEWMAVISFELDGTIIDANANFLRLFDYQLNDIKGKHHRMFVDPSYANSHDYRQFWADLNAGISHNQECKRIGRNGKEVWIQALYNVIVNDNGKPIKVVKFATDISARNQKNNEYKAQVDAINKSQAVIEFDVSGTILDANAIFLETMKYQSDELIGKHHRVFVDETYRVSSAYKTFWDELRAGEFQTGEFKRLSKHGDEIWLKATYSPIFDMNGQVVKVIKVATNISEQANIFKAIKQSAKSLSKSSGDLTEISQQMSSNAEETAVQANVVSAAAEQVSKSLQTVANSSNELNLSIKEIAKNTSEASRVAIQAVKVTENTSGTISKLGESSEEIGNVIKVITSIAQQTNLLALNATIEAARAGEAGKGFAVVANEVKELAKETAKATEDISRKIQTIQSDTKSAVQAISEINTIINQINEFQNTISSAVEEQSVTTNEIGRNVSEAAKGGAEIAQNISGVAQAAQSTSIGSNDSQKAAADLSQMASELAKLVEKFDY